MGEENFENTDHRMVFIEIKCGEEDGGISKQKNEEGEGKKTI